jgi:hypothetical protein
MVLKILNARNHNVSYIWNMITKQEIERGFHLGIQFQEF